jgi:ribosomal protein L19E
MLLYGIVLVQDDLESPVLPKVIVLSENAASQHPKERTFGTKKRALEAAVKIMIKHKTILQEYNAELYRQLKETQMRDVNWIQPISDIENNNND